VHRGPIITGRAAPKSEREALAGLVERVTLDSPETGLGVLRVKLRGQRELMTAGAAAPIGDGEFVQAAHHVPRASRRTPSQANRPGTPGSISV
jgi:hypothetical protein